ncbi:hypothetical protein Tco_0962038, partial [Tanacetum coccineum]
MAGGSSRDNNLTSSMQKVLSNDDLLMEILLLLPILLLYLFKLMKNGNSEWSVKYFVNLDDMMRPFPTWRIPADKDCYHILSIFFGEGEEDSFMVLTSFNVHQTVKFIESYEIDRKIEESVKEVVSSSVKHAMRAPLRAHFKDLPTPDMKEIMLQRMLEENYDKGHADHRGAYEALRDSIRRDESEDFDKDKAQEETKKKSKQDSPKPPPSGASGASGTTGASDSAKAPPLPPPASSTHQEDQSTGTAAPSSS